MNDLPKVSLISREHGTRTLAMLIVFLLAACTFQNVAYRNLDWLLHRQFDKYFDVPSAKSKAAYQAIDAEVARFKREDVPKLRADLEEILQRSEDGLDDTDAKWIAERFWQLRAQAMVNVARTLYPTIKDLTAKEREALRDNVEEQQKKWRKRLNASEDEFWENEEERTEDRFEQWFGPLTRQQIKDWTKLAIQSQEMARDRFAGRLEAQAAFFAYLERSPPTLAQLEEWAREPQLLRDKYRQLTIDQEKRLPHLIAAIAKDLTPTQQKFAQVRIKAWLKTLAQH